MLVLGDAVKQNHTFINNTVLCQQIAMRQAANDEPMVEVKLG